MPSPFDSQILKYPSTYHLEDSRLQPGDEGKGGVPFSALHGGEVVYEEKIDGANCGFRFDGAGEPYGQSRGHYLDLHDRSNWRERHWNPFKGWLIHHRDVLLERFEDRFVVFGEWLGAAHTVFYDRLPHLFLEFDIYDLTRQCFLDTPTRRELCRDLPLASVPVLYRGAAVAPRHLRSFVGPSAFRTPSPGSLTAPGAPAPEDAGGWRAGLRRACALVGDDFDARLRKMDGSDLSEGLYIKVEAAGLVAGRYKYVRHEFTQTILAADEHWLNRIPVPNLLAGPTDIFPRFLARAQDSPGTDYDPDAPWTWAPWVPAGPRGPASTPATGRR